MTLKIKYTKKDGTKIEVEIGAGSLLTKSAAATKLGISPSQIISINKKSIL